MSRRKRAYIPLIELLASALADRLSIEERDALRRAEPRVPARQIVRMFSPDHIALHAFDGADKWWNLDMRRRGADLKAKDRADTSRAAKSVRIRADEEAHKLAIRKLLRVNADARRQQRKKYQWPSRPFPRRRKER